MILFHFIKMQILNSLQYRFHMIFMMLSNLLVLLTNLCIWQSLYKGKGLVGGVSLEQMVTYTIISNVLSAVFFTSTAEKTAKQINSGDIIFDLYRPYPYLLRYLGEDIGNVVSGFVLRSIPVLIAVSFLSSVPLPVDAVSFLLFLVSIFCSYILLWLMDALFGVLNFWTLGFGNLAKVELVLVRIFSGSFIPLWFFPEYLRDILYLTPFPYTYQLPISIYIGKADLQESVRTLALQGIWIVFLSAVLALLAKRAVKKVLIQGG